MGFSSNFTFCPEMEIFYLPGSNVTDISRSKDIARLDQITEYQAIKERFEQPKFDSIVQISRFNSVDYKSFVNTDQLQFTEVVVVIALVIGEFFDLLFVHFSCVVA